MCSRKKKQEKLKQVDHIMNKLKPYWGCNMLMIMMEYYIYEFFALDFLKTIPEPPASFGMVSTSHFQVVIKKCKYSFNVFSRIIGPSGSTIQAIQRFSGCQLKVKSTETCDLHVNMVTEACENVAKWRFEKAKEAISYVLQNKNNEVSSNQRAEQMVRKRCREIQRAKNAYGPGIFNFDDNAMIEKNEEDGNETQSAAILEDFSNETGDHDQ
ncbi:hypothetical protein T12_4383 [Trichinella patagoniensis]|uniref:K Homology domain-containing protein n=1 Tax=Trichinella patagoniensis TaxID=990121 RepID=A0A0V0ZIW1_9BILA|nr:hypothetical protein T12_4383 [Trichinella patagoniensis]